MCVCVCVWGGGALCARPFARCCLAASKLCGWRWAETVKVRSESPLQRTSTHVEARCAGTLGLGGPSGIASGCFRPRAWRTEQIPFLTNILTDPSSQCSGHSSNRVTQTVRWLTTFQCVFCSLVDWAGQYHASYRIFLRLPSSRPGAAGGLAAILVVCTLPRNKAVTVQATVFWALVGALPSASPA